MASKNFSPNPALGISLMRPELEMLRAHGISCKSEVQIVRQNSGRLLLRGEEPGGGTPALGHYAGLAPIVGLQFESTHSFRNAIPNGPHLWAWGMAMVRFEVFRYSLDFVHCMISLHTLLPINKPGRSGVFHATKLLFKERYGELSNGSSVSFISNAGEKAYIPEFLQPGFLAALAGSRCRACEHKSHFADVQPIRLPDLVRQGLKFPNTQPKQETVHA